MIILRQKSFSDDAREKRKERAKKRARNALITTGAASGYLIGDAVGEAKKQALMDKALKKALEADLHGTMFNDRMKEVRRRGIKPEDADRAIKYLNGVKNRIEMEGKEAVNMAKKANKAPYKGMAIGTAAGAALGYGAHKFLNHKNNNKK